MMIKMRLNQSERARLIALAQHYNLPVSHAGFSLAIKNAIAEMSGRRPSLSGEDYPPAPDQAPDYLTIILGSTADDALAAIARRAGLGGAPWKETIFFCVNTVLFESTTDIGALQRADRILNTARILAQLDPELDAPTTVSVLAQLETHTEAAHDNRTL
jgi:hypothetical protein